MRRDEGKKLNKITNTWDAWHLLLGKIEDVGAVMDHIEENLHVDSRIPFRRADAYLKLLACDIELCLSRTEEINLQRAQPTPNKE